MTNEMTLDYALHILHSAANGGAEEELSAAVDRIENYIMSTLPASGLPDAYRTFLDHEPSIDVIVKQTTRGPSWDLTVKDARSPEQVFAIMDAVMAGIKERLGEEEEDDSAAAD